MYHYAGNNPVKYTDPTGRWIDNEDGTFTAEEGDTLYGLYGDDWQSKSGFTRDPSTLQVGETVGKLNNWTVTGSGSGVGLFASAIFFGGGEIDKSWYSMDFVIEETGEQFSANFTSTNVSGDDFKIGIGIYAVSIETIGIFEGKKPSPERIKESFSGESDVVGFSLLYFGVTGSDSGNFTTNTGTFGFSVGAPFSYGVEKSYTMERK